jgi:hypothetical protein
LYEYISFPSSVIMSKNWTSRLSTRSSVSYHSNIPLHLLTSSLFPHLVVSVLPLTTASLSLSHLTDDCSALPPISRHIFAISNPPILDQNASLILPKEARPGTTYASCRHRTSTISGCECDSIILSCLSMTKKLSAPSAMQRSQRSYAYPQKYET